MSKINFTEASTDSNEDIFAEGKKGSRSTPKASIPPKKATPAKKVRIFTDLEKADIERIDRITAKKQREQTKVVTRAAVIRDLILESLNRK